MASIQVFEDEKNRSVIISIHDCFDFGVHKEFRASYKDREDSNSYVIDMKNVNYIDSSALGMMLLLHEHAAAHKGKVLIKNCNPEIKKILTIANFDRLFDIS